MGWVLTAVMLAAFVTVFAVYVILLRRDADDVQARTRRHLDAGGSVSDAPDITPGHGGGAAGG